MKFTPDHGDIRVKAHAEDRYVQVLVSDSGPGIPNEFATHIFEPFRTGAKTCRRELVWVLLLCGTLSKGTRAPYEYYPCSPDKALRSN